MSPARHPDRQVFETDDLVLSVPDTVEQERWDESIYEPFLDALCETREYQKEAILTALRYLLGGRHPNLRALASENFEENSALNAHYGSWGNLKSHLQFPDHLSASLDLATGTGKTYVLYGLAAIMLAAGHVDQVLVLCPSVTIETQLLAKFRQLAGDAELLSLLSEGQAPPRVIDGSYTIVPGSICVENYHAILEKTGSSVRDSLVGRGSRTLVLNDEAHHSANSPQSKATKWKEFLQDPTFGFDKMIGVSGTCFVGNMYFTDVIYRFSLRSAIEQRFVKKIEYVADMPQTRSREESWQLIYKNHERIAAGLAARRIKPLTIVVTNRINRCKELAEELTEFLMEHAGLSANAAGAKVLAVYNGAPGVTDLPKLDNPASDVEWVVSVSMLNEGWDVKRVFQIVPHEERAFNSKLLISQVLGRGMRIPEDWKGKQPHVTVFNHDAWAPRIRHLVNEVLEIEKRISTDVEGESKYHFGLENLDYVLKPSSVFDEPTKQYNLLEKGYVDLASEPEREAVLVEFERAGSAQRWNWQTTIDHQTYEHHEVAEQMFDRLCDADEESGERYYTSRYPVERLLQIVEASLKRIGATEATENMRQRFLQALGTLRRRRSQAVRYEHEVSEFRAVQTTARPGQSVGAAELRYSKTLFYTPGFGKQLPPDQREFFAEATEAGSGFKVVLVKNRHSFRTPALGVIADSDPERRFLTKLVETKHARLTDAWVKSAPSRFYEIEYFWKKGTNPKRGRFSPDFFIVCGDLVVVAEIKGDEEISDPSPENVKKHEFAVAHFERLNSLLAEQGKKRRYKLTFVTQRSFAAFFQALSESTLGVFRSELDVVLTGA